MIRRQFLKSSVILTAAFIASSRTALLNAAEKATNYATESKDKIVAIIKNLKKEGTNLVAKVMDGKKYKFDPYTHYPYDGGIKDKKTGYQLFFHAHRQEEYGHFHTFATDDDGELIHLILISMNKEGELIGLATVNRWVTGDKFVSSDKLKKVSSNFEINSSLYKDGRVIEFVNNVFKAYSNLINKLYDERDDKIKEYAKRYYREPFEDRNLEILSERKISLTT